MGKAYKAFDENMKCRGFQYKSGETYTEPDAELRAKGFHACERPLDTLRYYPPTSRFCEVDLDGKIVKAQDDTKCAATQITIGAEIGMECGLR